MSTSHSIRILTEMPIPGLNIALNRIDANPYIEIPERVEPATATDPSLFTYQGAPIESLPTGISSESCPVATELKASSPSPAAQSKNSSSFSMIGILGKPTGVSASKKPRMLLLEPPHAKAGYDPINDSEEAAYTSLERLAMDSVTAPLASPVPTKTAGVESYYDKASLWWSSLWTCTPCKAVDPRHVFEAAVDLGLNTTPNRLPVRMQQSTDIF